LTAIQINRNRIAPGTEAQSIQPRTTEELPRETRIKIKKYKVVITPQINVWNLFKAEAIKKSLILGRNMQEITTGVK